MLKYSEMGVFDLYCKRIHGAGFDQWPKTEEYLLLQVVESLTVSPLASIQVASIGDDIVMSLCCSFVCSIDAVMHFGSVVGILINKLFLESIQ